MGEPKVHLSHVWDDFPGLATQPSHRVRFLEILAGLEAKTCRAIAR